MAADEKDLGVRSQEFQEGLAKQNEERIVATREWLLEAVEHTTQVPIRGTHCVEIRERLNAEEQTQFPEIYKDISEAEKIALAEGNAAELPENEASQKELPLFLSTIIVNPKVEAEDIDKVFTEAEKIRILKAFLIGIYTDANQEAVAFFRMQFGGPDNAGDMAPAGKGQKGARKDAKK